MNTKIIIRYVSGREEQFEVEVFGGTTAEARLREFIKNPTLVFRTEKEVVIIPATAVESITVPLTESADKGRALPEVRKARRLK
jgi:hypothetical protein